MCKLKEYKLRVKKYLELDNVSILAGAGTSFHLGAPIIRTIPKELKEKYSKEISRYFNGVFEPSFEDLGNCLQADRFLKKIKRDSTDEIDNMRKLASDG